MELTLQSLRKPRVLGIVVFDTIATILGALLISRSFNVGFLLTVFVLFIASVILHVVFKVDTHTNYLLGLSADPVAKELEKKDIWADDSTQEMLSPQKEFV